MSALFAVVRTVHYASVILLFGEFIFASVIKGSAWRASRAGEPFPFTPVASTVARWGLVASLLSGAAWLVLEGGVMSGLPIRDAMQQKTLALVLTGTGFGHVWILRALVAVGLGVVLVGLRKCTVDTRRRRFLIVATLLAAIYLATLAWAGHAAASQGSDGDIGVLADVVHLIAAGAWLGALPALVAALADADDPYAAARSAARFSTLGLVCVAALVGSGAANAWYQVGDVPALIGTRYGQLLLVKLALFAAMLVLAMVNRGILARRVEHGDRDAQRILRRNAIIEIVFGIGVVAIVGRLGVTPPAIHEVPVWPFAHTLSFAPLQLAVWRQLAFASACTILMFAAMVVAKGALARPPRVSIVALAGVALPVGLVAWLLVVPAFPTSYEDSPVGYTARAVAAGSTHYAALCADCHGRDGRGDGGAAAALSRAPGDLAESVTDRRVGELFWWIAHGIPGTPMPGFGTRLSDVDIWNLVRFLDAQSAARNALAMTDRIKPLLPIPAPDFTFERMGRPQESLLLQRGNRVTLLVLYSSPSSLPRLVEIAANYRAFEAAGARIIAIPIGSWPGVEPRSIPGGEAILAIAGAEVGTAYALFAGPATRATDGAAKHLEYLIDRNGDLRVRYVGIPEDGRERTTAMLGQIDALSREPPRPLRAWGHGH